MKNYKIYFFLCVFILISFFYPNIANAKNIYKNEVYGFSVLLDKAWKLKSESELASLSPEEKEELIEAMVNTEDGSSLTFRVKKKGNPIYAEYQRVLESNPESSEREFYRLTRPTTVFFGMSLQELEVEEGERVYISFLGSSGQGKIEKEIYWSPFKDESILELEYIKISKKLDLFSSSSIRKETFSTLTFGDERKSEVRVISNKEGNFLNQKMREYTKNMDFTELLMVLFESIDFLVAVIYFFFALLLSFVLLFVRK